MTVSILCGDCREILRQMPTDSVHCVVTSPPYWGLRDYGIAGQLGLEASLGEYIDMMVEVFREVRRVLRKDGTLWLNLGDSYAASISGRSAADKKALGNDDRTFRDKPFSTIGPIWRRNNPEGEDKEKGSTLAGTPQWNSLRNSGFHNLKPKDICGIPWRLAFALQADGWWLRQDIIWSKPNPMPESVTDRCTKAHEYLFLLSKSERYYYDAEAIVEDANSFGRQHTTGIQPPKVIALQDSGHHGRGGDLSINYERHSRNKRSVWEIATAPFAEAHFATFPPALIEPCIRAGCPKECCAKCGAPLVREVERPPIPEEMFCKARTDITDPNKKASPLHSSGKASGAKMQKWLDANPWKTTGWAPSCFCNAGTVPGIVLDPFGGAGTTGLVADRLQRNAILIELNPAYAAMARGRIEDDAPLFTQIHDYNATDDFARSIDECYREIRDRKAKGGKGWGGWE
jgi:DNA modification methylase